MRRFSTNYRGFNKDVFPGHYRDVTSVLCRVGADVDVSIEDVSLSGRVQIVFEMDHLVPFPHMKSVAVTFLEK